LPQDTTFSSAVTALFVRPIFKILGEVGDVRSEGQISLKKTKWLTLVGASLAVISSTAFYINVGFFVVLGDYEKPFYVNPYLHALIFGVNLDSVLNDIGMLLACGVVKKITYETVTTHFRSFSANSRKSQKVDPAAPPVFDSEAYNEPQGELRGPIGTRIGCVQQEKL
jgi:hypothetical protein